MKAMVNKICFFVAAPVLAAVINVATAEEPMRLTQSQLDTVTAGDIGVVASAAATATGDTTVTYTGTATDVGSSPGRGVVEKGTGLAVAYAAGETQSAEVAVGGYADGGVVNKVQIHSKEIDTPTYDLAEAKVKVMSVNPPGLEKN